MGGAPKLDIYGHSIVRLRAKNTKQGFAAGTNRRDTARV